MAAPKGNTNAKKKSRTRVPVALSIGDARLDWVIAKLHDQGIDDPAQKEIIRFVKDFCYGKIDEDVKRMKAQEEKRRFYYARISLDDLKSTDLQKEASDGMEAYRIKILDHAENADALYDPSSGRLGIAWGADATWANVSTLDSGIEMWLNDGEEWERNN